MHNAEHSSPWAAPAEQPKQPNYEAQLAELERQGAESGNEDEQVFVAGSGELESKNGFSLGQEVVVPRNGKNGAPNYTEGGWYVTALLHDEHDSVMVSRKDGDQVMDKRLSMKTMVELNPVAVSEKEPFPEGAKEIADAAIENAIGVTDPAGEIEPEARLFGPGEISRLMKDDRESRASGAFKRGELKAMMSGDSQEVASAEAAPDTNYDNLFNDAYDSAEYSVQGAAVQHEEDEGKRLTRERREADHKYNLAKQTERIRDGGN